jgi:hypothetical protein
MKILLSKGLFFSVTSGPRCSYSGPFILAYPIDRGIENGLQPIEEVFVILRFFKTGNNIPAHGFLKFLMKSPAG